MDYLSTSRRRDYPVIVQLSGVVPLRTNVRARVHPRAANRGPMGLVPATVLINSRTARFAILPLCLCYTRGLFASAYCCFCLSWDQNTRRESNRNYTTHTDYRCVSHSNECLLVGRLAGPLSRSAYLNSHCVWALSNVSLILSRPVRCSGSKGMVHFRPALPALASPPPLPPVLICSPSHCQGLTDLPHSSGSMGGNGWQPCSISLGRDRLPSPFCRPLKLFRFSS